MNHNSPRFLLFVLLLACAGAACQATDTEARPPDTASPEWTPLFNGEDLGGWTPKFSGEELGVNYLDTFRVEDGKLVVSYANYQEFDGKFGHLFHATEYSHYVLQLEYRFTGEQCPGAPGWALRNNGIMFHGQPAETMGLDQNFPCSIEAQMLGGTGGESRPTGNVCTPGTLIERAGELVRDHVVRFEGPTIPDDRWVRYELEVHGSERVVHRIDGEVVAEYGGLRLDVDDPSGAAEATRRGTTQLRGGTISLQAESHPCEFRDLRIRALPGS